MVMTLTKQLVAAQPQLVNFFLKVASKKQISHSYIIEGQDSILLYDVGLWLAQLLLCEQPNPDGSPCGECLTCRRVVQFDYPDVLTITPEGQTIKVDQVREMKQLLTKSGMEGKQKILIIQSAEKMTVSSANTLLKFIEEPEGDMFILFLTNNSQRLLPTIQSRCQLVSLAPVVKQVMISQLVAQQIPEESAKLLAELCPSLETAVELFNDEWFNNAKDVVQKWFGQLQTNNPLAFITVQQYLVKLAKEKPQQLLVFDLLVAYYRLDMEKAKVYQITKTKTIELILTSRRKLDANVSFQNVAEQLVWRIMA